MGLLKLKRSSALDVRRGRSGAEVPKHSDAQGSVQVNRNGEAAGRVELNDAAASTVQKQPFESRGVADRGGETSDAGRDGDPAAGIERAVGERVIVGDDEQAVEVHRHRTAAER